MNDAHAKAPDPAALSFESTPSALVYLAKAFLPPSRRPLLQVRGPRIQATWSGYRAPPADLEHFSQLAFLASERNLPALFLQSVAIRINMVILCHPAFPVRIWNVLQIRNRISLLAEIPKGAPLNLQAAVLAYRAVEKGLEIDVRTAATADGGLVFESLNTFFARGRFGTPQPASDAARSPRVQGEVRAVHRMPNDGGWRFGGITGDYNGIHLSNTYARVFGFRGATLHPQRVVGLALSRLPNLQTDAPHRMDVWLKGSVPYGAEVRVRSEDDTEGRTTLGAFVGGDPRPAIVVLHAPRG
ncbi:MAG: hypothetical protein IT285_04630 [Bdellovibrionales bacterium]|nr:hypothetical protein [Bdellovibrionales bacterium]